MVGNAPHRLGTPNTQPNTRTVEAMKIYYINEQTTDIFVSRFTLHRGYRTINLINVTYTIDKYPQMHKTGSNPRNINMKSQINIIATMTTLDFISTNAAAPPISYSSQHHQNPIFEFR